MPVSILGRFLLYPKSVEQIDSFPKGCFPDQLIDRSIWIESYKERQVGPC